jgi:hypothetical protein
MNAFTARYQSETGSTLQHLPLWDAAAAFRQIHEFEHWALEPDDLLEWRGKHAAFAEMALAGVTAARY